MEGHALPDHVASAVDEDPWRWGSFGDSDHREYLGRTRNFSGYHFWARLSVRLAWTNQAIRDYIRVQEAEEKKQEKLALG